MKQGLKPVKTTDYDWLVKVILLGDSGVGKTNILTQYCEGKFSGNYMPTIGVDFKIKTVQVEDKKIKLQIWDTAGQERFRNITQTYYKGAYGIIFAYSISDRHSFTNVENWIKSIRDNTTEEVCSLIIGNKCDLNTDRKVEFEEGQQLARSHNMEFIETSAKDGTNISNLCLGQLQDKIFEILGNELKQRLEREEQQNLQEQEQTIKLNGQEVLASQQQPKGCGC